MKAKDNHITNILFDLGNVLVPVHWERAIEQLLPHLSPEKAELLRSDRSAFQELIREPAVALETGQLELAGFYRAVSEILGLALPMDEFHRIWCDIFSLDEGMVSLGERLARKYGTWLLSNTSAAHYQWIIHRFPRVAFYRAAALSYELGVMKPARVYYERALHRLDIEPEQSVFVDDLPENVEGAIRTGIHGIVFTGRADFVRELRILGIEVPYEEE